MEELLHDDTLAIHHGYDTSEAKLAIGVPIFQSNSFEFENAAHAAAMFNLERPGHIYSRLSNPTNEVLEQRLTRLERAEATVCVASGSAAVSYAISNIVRPGDNIITFEQLYGATYTYVRHLLPSMGVETRFALGDAASDVVPLIDARTRCIYCESITNPGGRIHDIATLGSVAEDARLPLIVDNTVASPALIKPIEYGASVVVASLGKFIGGHGAALGGAITDSGRFEWRKNADAFPMLTRPEPAYHDVCYVEQSGRAAFAARCRTVALRNTGAALSPFNAFMILQGLHTLQLRIARHSENAKKLVEFLTTHRAVASVESVGLPDHPQNERALRYLDGRYPSLFAFRVKGGFSCAAEFYDRLQLCKRMINVGDVRTNVCHPASTTHRQLTDAELDRAGISPDMIRVCVGIENAEDIIRDFDRALIAA
ncbi:MAG TPA: aminotransferase class I/II-fold pyridoxal phosphate-dependent enzyme [Xanthobacteraceae bacterium]|nr:aminotransferase class I/II-fold pyridoxal phosphate-dependent enzyme [Xanthobacteraceae bacterium]